MDFNSEQKPRNTTYADKIWRIDILKERLGISTLHQLKGENAYWINFLSIVAKEGVSPGIITHIAGLFGMTPNDFTIKCESEYLQSIKKECESLLRTYLYEEADNYYNKNIDYIDKDWYINTRNHYYNLMTSTVESELTAILNEFCQLQRIGISRSLWNQDYSQRKYDEIVISKVSKRILKIREDMVQFPKTLELLTTRQKNKITSFRKYITNLKKNLDYQANKERVSLSALNATWDSCLFIQDMTKLEKPLLGEEDQVLISNWSQQLGSSVYWDQAMTSAREAEVAALKNYCNLYGNAEDISILQITSPEDDRWKYADIATNGRWIDIKNARRSFSSKNSYSEHCVPRFKLDRNKRDVSISSFLSPYRDDEPQNIIWLGETTLGEIEKLQREFSNRYLEVTFATHLNNSFLPAWLFDYPSACYADRDAALSVIRSPEFIFPRQECPIGVGILADRIISSRTAGRFGLEATELERRIKKCGLSRPVLFLHILERFCRTVVDNTELKTTGIDKILFPDFQNDTKTPLGVYDPLETVWNLWKILVAVSEKCLQEAKWFTFFRLRGCNILQGRKNDGSWSTVFAYCGGWTRLNNDTKVKCGQTPIYLGKDFPCQSCSRLICHCCGFCSSQCPECQIRQENWTSNNQE